MFGALRVNWIVAVTAVFLVVPLLPQALEAQAGSRVRVIVPNAEAMDGSSDRFGQRFADRTRDLLDLERHVAMSEREIDQAAREFGMRYRDLDCLGARQLAVQIDVGVVLCGEYRAEGDQFAVDVNLFTVPDAEEFSVASFTVAQNDERGAAQQTIQGFNTLAEQLNTITWCTQQYASSNYEGALEQCQRAVELAPDAEVPRRALANTYRELEQWEAALEQFEVLLERDPYNDNYMQNAGWLAAQVGDRDRAREYYSRYLQQNPENVQVRLTVAHELAQAGDPYGAMNLLQEGMEQQPDDPDLHERFGTYAFRAALELQQAQPMPAAAQDSDAPRLSPEVEELFLTAAHSLELVLEARGSETQPSYVVNLIRAYRQLGDTDNAVRIGQRGTELFPENAQIYSNLANAYNEAGQVDQAIRTLERAIELDPNLPQARMRQGNFLLQAGRIDDAIPALKAAAEAGEAGADQLSGMIFSFAWQNHVQPQENLQRGIALIEEAKTFEVSQQFREQLDYIHAYALLRRGEEVQAPGNLESARAALPIFQRARELAVAGTGHAQRTGQSIQGLLDPIDTYIQIQEAIIAREGRRR